MDTHWKILFLLLVFPALIACILVWLQVQNFRTRHWLEASGRIVSSKAAAQTVRRLQRDTDTDNRTSTTTERFETKNFAEIAYEFTVAGRKVQGSRIDLGAGSGATEVSKTLKRYPQGKIVAVIYDPADPSSCILERHDPKKILMGWGAVVALGAIMTACVFGVERYGLFLRAATPHPDRMPIVVFLTIFGAALALFSHMMGKEARAMQGWTRTAGRIVHSKVETAQQERDRPNSVSFQTLYFPRVVYAYTAGGQGWQGDSIGWTVSNSTPDAAKKIVARFPLDSKVDVFFDPDDESVSTLDRGGSIIRWILLAGALLFACAALATAGMMPFGFNF